MQDISFSKSPCLQFSRRQSALSIRVSHLDRSRPMNRHRDITHQTASKIAFPLVSPPHKSIKSQISLIPKCTDSRFSMIQHIGSSFWRRPMRFSGPKRAIANQRQLILQFIKIPMRRIIMSSINIKRISIISIKKAFKPATRYIPHRFIAFRTNNQRHRKSLFSSRFLEISHHFSMLFRSDCPLVEIRFVIDTKYIDKNTILFHK